MPSEWIRPAACESGSCVEYRTVGDKVFVRNGGTENLSDDGNILQFTVAEWDTFVAGLVASAPCSCQSWPPDGPSPDCAVHGAIRALNETMVERDQLAAENARLRQDLAEEKATTKRALDSYERMGKAASRYSAEHEEAEGELRSVIAELLVLRHRYRRTQAVVDAAVALHAGFAARKPGGGSAELCALEWAVEDYLKGPTEALPTPQSDEQPPDVAEEATDGLEAQGGAQRDAEVSWKSPVDTTSAEEADGWQAIQGLIGGAVWIDPAKIWTDAPEVLPEPAAPTAADLQAARDQTRADAKTMLTVTEPGIEVLVPDGGQFDGGTPTEYRDPDGHYPPNSGTMVCNKCGGDIWTGDDGWACNCDSAMFEYAKPDGEVPEAGRAGEAQGWREGPCDLAGCDYDECDPPTQDRTEGLDAAIEAACAVHYGASWPTADKVLAAGWRSDMAEIIRAASPLIERAALLKRIRSLQVEAKNHAEKWPQPDWDRGYVRGMERAIHDLANNIPATRIETS